MGEFVRSSGLGWRLKLPLKKIAQTDAIFDMATCPLLVPCGILEIASGQLTIGFGQGTSTSDTVADNLQQWWSERKAVHPHIRKLMIDLDNGPEVSSRRTQFMKRLTQFADKHNLEIELVYYPPYHSKYNADHGDSVVTFKLKSRYCISTSNVPGTSHPRFMPVMR